MGMNPYIMLVTREEIHPDNNMHYYNELKHGVALMEDGMRIPVDTETEKRKIICSFSVYDFDCSSGGYPMRTYAYVRRDYEEVFYNSCWNRVLAECTHGQGSEFRGSNQHCGMGFDGSKRWR